MDVGHSPVPERLIVCSYCGCRSITVIRRFTEEHERIINAAGALQGAARRGDVGGTRDRAAEVAHLLEPHTQREERGLFHELRHDSEFTDHIDGLCDEHDDLDDRLDGIAGGELSGVDEFVDRLRQHIDREENGLFPAAAVALFGPSWERVEHAEQMPVAPA